MARKKTIFKEQILEGAMQLIKRDGIDNLTARNIASELNCSTQPIYNEYKNMDGLREDIVNQFDEILIKKVFNDFDENLTFKEIATNYIRFASEESLLFYSIYINHQEFSDRLHRRLNELMSNTIQRIYPDIKEPESAWLQLYPMLFGLAALITMNQIDIEEIDMHDRVSTYIKSVKALNN